MSLSVIVVCSLSFIFTESVNGYLLVKPVTVDQHRQQYQKPSLVQLTSFEASHRPPFTSPQDDRLERWTNAAFAHIRNFSCDDILFMTPTVCSRLLATPGSSMAVHYAPVTVDGKYTASTPHTERLRHSSRHDAILVVDPFPERHYQQHLLLIFYVDLAIEPLACINKGGTHLGMYTHTPIQYPISYKDFRILSFCKKNKCALSCVSSNCGYCGIYFVLRNS